MHDLLLFIAFCLRDHVVLEMFFNSKTSFCDYAGLNLDIPNFFKKSKNFLIFEIEGTLKVNFLVCKNCLKITQFFAKSLFYLKEILIFRRNFFYLNNHIVV